MKLDSLDSLKHFPLFLEFTGSTLLIMPLFSGIHTKAFLACLLPFDIDVNTIKRFPAYV